MIHRTRPIGGAWLCYFYVFRFLLLLLQSSSRPAWALLSTLPCGILSAVCAMHRSRSNTSHVRMIATHVPLFCFKN